VQGHQILIEKGNNHFRSEKNQYCISSFRDIQATNIQGYLKEGRGAVLIQEKQGFSKHRGFDLYGYNIPYLNILL
jgi:hypothetical protein